MTVLLVLATFLAFAIVDWLLHRKEVVQIAPERPDVAPAPLERAYVEGFLVPERLRYHPGHTWVMNERKELVRVGMDEFASALAGHVERIEFPKPGQWIRQGQKAILVHRDGETTELVSPVEGEVSAINEEVLKNPAILRDDPYGQGWLMTVTVPDEESTMRNLVPASMVRTWMSDAVRRLYALQPQVAGMVAADGGRPVHDLLTGVPDASWTKVTREFFLTA